MLPDLPRALDCLAEPDAGAGLLEALRPNEIAAYCAALRTQGRAEAAALLESGAAGGSAGATAGRVVLAAPDLAMMLLGEGAVHAPLFGAFPAALPAGSVWRLSEATEAAWGEAACLGFCLGAYRPGLLKTKPGAAMARLIPPAGAAAALRLARVIWLVRDLINLPPNLLGPDMLAGLAQSLTAAAGMAGEIVAGVQAEDRFPMLAHAGQAASRGAYVFCGRWQGSGATASSPLLSLCGKGVIFDSGGLDIKPPSAMLRMKKDMAGAAIMLGLALLVMQADLDLRLELRLGCIENAIAGNAMRPSDVVRTRKGLSVEIGNTDAEGRLVLCDLLAEAAEAAPDVLIDAATLTGAARVALGPEITALFTDSDQLAAQFAASAERTGEAVWRMPLHAGYAAGLESAVADLGNVWDKPYAGAIIAALFLQRFAAGAKAWAHLDVFAFNEATRPGKPAGGEAEALRCLFDAVCNLAPSASAGL